MRPALSWQSDGPIPCASLPKQPDPLPTGFMCSPEGEGSFDSPADLSFSSEGLLRMPGSWPLSHLPPSIIAFPFPTSVLIGVPLRPRQAHIIKVLGQVGPPRAVSTQLTCRLRCGSQLHLSSDPTTTAQPQHLSSWSSRAYWPQEGNALLTRCW